ncbi:dna topoisomerase : DNA topoisomerase (ATP-hydrolyzing) OS=uncultured planctomycete GN=HGMM_F22C11C08 PE=4 SV=1: DNA_topoisoIV: DNA_gyraseA_C: DNA_gyraseA_C: DNA_gyraseA_C [Gemmata massiliana]|uniref:DNA topoisomerase (ATP-hydrolyzing) n=1 Tax=Gemmata massiliana TaxID=1210884 RepID=A0A6P2D2M5_9BACT|nr:DNA topoisomerase (ATP-hydrolyzing) [Gemmata massiliana]VTR94645.1 dna topoisomerase : DNA topoisomerase (ATP-hydrolyzing) OS=uncultured planctomycete GN=HGMM_F22C11C08 PE=4 SV=1: DNA_topoisoIV: DNA_gyraseA_C: DNA_gyraseA_C: DNA_gyraseA_C [Gemmata massiliana]
MAESIETVSIASEVRTRFLTYAMSVVSGRALPDVRDGLKPVQRRILYAMSNDLNLSFDRKALKCAKIVGEVMGNYHPHGDSALYEALVRMSQNWVLRVPLVYGQGNFGSVDGDPPAAYRYTEAKLTRQAEMLLDELGQQTVDFNPSYDGTRQEPSVLPAQFPNLLVNGTAGIAVGMATQIPPHNLGEVLRGCVLLIDNPDASVANLLDKIKGPDFPLGGKILADRATLRKIYEEGTGTIKVQAEWKEEEYERGKSQIVVTSIPYGVNKGDLENTIGAIIDQRKLPQLTGQANESNEKDGLRLVLEVKAGTDPNLVMAYLYKHTELQKSFSYNVTALVPNEDGTRMVPKDGLSLKDLLRHFLDFRLATVRRRYEYHLRQLRKRIHILEGFAIIFNALDRAIKIIRESSGKSDAAEKLKSTFKLDDEQVGAILDSQLYKIAQMEIKKILDELAEKKKQAKEFEAILASEKKLWGVIKGELEKLIENFPERRKTRMASDEDVLTFDEEAYIVRENTNVVLTRNGRIKRVGRLAAVESTRVEEGDEVVAVIPGSTLDHVAFFADDGAAYTMRINEVPATAGYGEPITKFFKLGDGVKVVAAVTSDPRFTPADAAPKGDTPGGPFLLVCTRNGFVLRLPLTAFRTESTKVGRRFVKLETGDKVVMVRLVGAEESLMLATAGGYVTHFPLDQVSILSGAGRGVIGIELDPKDDCLGGILVGGRFDKLVVETENGKTQDFGPGAIKSRKRGAKGEKPGARTKFTRVVPTPIELADWDVVEGKKTKDDAKSD